MTRGMDREGRGLGEDQVADSPGIEPGGCTVDIVIPAYRGLESTRLCIESVLANPLRTAHALVVVDDASPEPALSRYLDALAKQGRITLLRNEHNLGFVQSVNRGMSLHPERDVVLLNSDTEVANDWLDRLRACAYREPRIATVTPFSNNATICSYPVFCDENALPDGVSLAGLDAVFKRVNSGKSLPIPTAVGFCMYIKRTSLNELGLFDAGRFGRGYGEENDFSRRAIQAGWRNVLCADTFVYHAGSVSFQAERGPLIAGAEAVMRQLHPDYFEEVRHFIRQDPVAPLRRAVEIELARQRMRGWLEVEGAGHEAGAEQSGKVQLHVVHDLGGGIQRWYQDYCRSDTRRKNLILKPFCHGQAFGSGLMLFADVRDAKPVGFWRFDSVIEVTAVAHPEYQAILDDIVRDYGVDAILVSSLIGHSLDVLSTGLPTLVIGHDFFPLCPAINLYFQGVCGQCDDARIAECFAGNPDFNPFQNFPPSQRVAVRKRYLELLGQKHIGLVAPTRSLRTHMLQIAPELRDVPFVAIPHGYSSVLVPIRPEKDDAGVKLRVMVLGMLSVSKGMRVLEAALPHLADFAEVYLVGAREVGERFRGRAGVHVVDEYAIEDLPGMVAGIRPHVGLLVSIWPETFSYTLSELMRLGIPPVATRLGGFAERIIDGDTGFFIEPDAGSLIARLRELDADRARLERVRENLCDLPRRSIEDMVADYHHLLPLSEPGMETGRTEGRPDATDLVGRDLALSLSTMWKEVKSLHLRLDMREALLREHAETIRQLRDGMATREAELRALRYASDAQARQLADVYVSTSWRVSWPVRWLGRKWRQMRALAASLRPLARRPARWLGIGRRLWAIARLSGPVGLKRAILHLPHLPSLGGGDPSGLDMAAAMQVRLLELPSLPRISILVPVFNTPEIMLREMLDSVCAQLYPNWQLCIADDGSSESHVQAVLEDYAARDARIRLDFAAENSGVSCTTNRALAMAEGDFIVLLDHDDLLEAQALFRVAEAVLADDPDMLYSDEVLVAEDGKTVQHFLFRPMFSPEYLRSHPYIVHLIGFRPSLLRALGGLDETLRISQDYDLILRASEQANKITHIPEMLYRWRIHGGSAGHEMIGRVMETSRTILQRHINRCGEKGMVTDGPSFNFFDVRYPLDPALKVAILIPTKNHGELVRICIESIERTAGDVRHEVVLIDHESDDPASLAYFDSIRSRVTLLRYSGPFNFSAINNWAVAQLDGSHTHYLLCNNDIEAIETGWLGRMLELGQKPDVGIVGAKLYYPDRRMIQHAGVAVPCCGVAENLGRFLVTREDSKDTGYGGSLVCNREVSAVTAACMLIRADVFKTVGGFDDSIAVGFGDVDFCLRVGELGRRVLFCAHAELVHHESYTRGRSREDPHPKDTANFLKKWRNVMETGDPYFNPNLSPHSPNWQVADPLELKLNIRRRTFRREPGSRI